MRAFRVLISIMWLTLAAALLPAADSPGGGVAAERDAHDVVLLAPDRPVIIRLHVQVDGQGLQAVRVAYAEQLFRRYDRDGDGLLDKDEARDMPALVKTGNGETVSVVENWVGIDRHPADDKVSLEELSAYIDGLLGSTFAISARPLRATQSVELFALLDVNRDGRLSQAELADAPRMLHKLDFDDDETFTIDELQLDRVPRTPRGPTPNQSPPGGEIPFVLLDDSQALPDVARQLIDRYGDAGRSAGGLDRASLNIDAESFAACDRDQNGVLDTDELAGYLRAPRPQVELDVSLLQKKPGRSKMSAISDPLHAVSQASGKSDRLTLSTTGLSIEWRAAAQRGAAVDNRKFYQGKFRVADADKNKYISESEFGQLGLPGADFKAVDRNGDGMIVEEELLAWVDQEAATSQARAEMIVAHDGKSVFEVLDANADRRLSRRELQMAVPRMREYDRDGDGMVSSQELIGRYTVTIELGKPGIFRMASDRAGDGGATGPMVTRPGSGPDWFRKMDRNRDGDVSRREFLGPLEAFRRLDTDGDGLISAAEAERAEAVQPGARSDD